MTKQQIWSHTFCSFFHHPLCLFLKRNGTSCKQLNLEQNCTQAIIRCIRVMCILSLGCFESHWHCPIVALGFVSGWILPAEGGVAMANYKFRVWKILCKASQRGKTSTAFCFSMGCGFGAEFVLTVFARHLKFPHDELWWIILCWCLLVRPWRWQ